MENSGQSNFSNASGEPLGGNSVRREEGPVPSSPDIFKSALVGSVPGGNRDSSSGGYSAFLREDEDEEDEENQRGIYSPSNSDSSAAASFSSSGGGDRASRSAPHAASSSNTVPLLGGRPPRHKQNMLLRPPEHLGYSDSDSEGPSAAGDDGDDDEFAAEGEEAAPFLGMRSLGPTFKWRRTRVWFMASVYYASFVVDTLLFLWFWRNADVVGSVYAWACLAFLALGFVFQCVVAMMRVCHHEDLNGSRACTVPLALCLTNTYVIWESLRLTGLLKGKGLCGLGRGEPVIDSSSTGEAAHAADEPFGDEAASLVMSDFWAIRRLQSVTQSLPQTLLYSFFLFSWMGTDMGIERPTFLLCCGIMVSYLSAGLGVRRMLMFSYRMGFQRTMVFMSGFAAELLLFMSISAAFGRIAFLVLLAKAVVVSVILAPLKDLNTELFGSQAEVTLDDAPSAPSSGLAAVMSRAPAAIRPDPVHINTIDLVMRVMLSGPCFYSYFRTWFVRSELKLISVLGIVDAVFFGLCCVFWTFYSGVWGSCGWILLALLLSVSVGHFFSFIFLLRSSPPTHRGR